ncbi:MAG: DNA primase [Caldisericia bacterium]|nr:DNA primase [Caldisericia bacterium]
MDQNIEEYVQEIKTRINIVDYIGKFVSLRKAGRNFVGLCPFHIEKTPSFSVNPSKEIFYCFGCHVGGDIIHFVEKYEGLSFQEAIEELGKEVGLPPPKWGKQKQNNKYEQWYNALEEVTSFFEHSLAKSSDAQIYLKKRNINESIAKQFNIGYAPSASREFLSMLESHGFDKELCKTMGLINKNDSGDIYPYFRQRLIFPIKDARSRTIGFGGRVVSKDKMPKYLNSPDYPLFHKGKNLYALSLARSEMNRSKKAILVEGYMDVVALHQKGFTNVLAALGTAFTIDQAKLLRKHADTLYFCYDADEAGKKAVLRSIDIILPTGLPCRIIQIPKPYKDPDEFITAKGEKAFRELIENAKGALEYYWEALTENKNLKDPMTQSALISSMFQRLSKVSDTILIEAMVKKISLDVRIRQSVLEERFFSSRSSFSSSKRKRRIIEKNKVSKSLISDRNAMLLLKAIITYPEDYAAIIFAKLSQEDFPEGVYRDLFAQLKTMNDEKKEINVENFQEDPDKEIFYSKLMELQSVNNDCIEGDVIHQILCSIDELNRKKEVILPLIEKINQAERSGDIEVSRKLREEYRRINQGEC